MGWGQGGSDMAYKLPPLRFGYDALEPYIADRIHDIKRGGPHMRTSEAFVLGTITGAVIVGLWGRTIEDYLGEKTPRGVAHRARGGLRGGEGGPGEGADRGRPPGP